MPRNQNAWISRMRMIPKKITVRTRARGRSTKYAPRTPAIAPLAPMFGMLASVTLPAVSVIAGLQRRRREARGEVPDEEAHLPERVLDVVAEDPEEEHVAEDVLPARVHEHRGEDALVPRQRMDRDRHRDVARALDRARVVAVLEDVHVDAGAAAAPRTRRAGSRRSGRSSRRASTASGRCPCSGKHRGYAAASASRTRSAAASSSSVAPVTSWRISSAVGFWPSDHSSRMSEPASLRVNHALPNFSRRNARSCASNAHARR